MAKTYVANYLFNYFGGDKVGDKLIRGATIDVAIRPYKNGKLIQFDPKTDPELFEIVDVSFDKSNIYKIKIHDGLEKNMCNRLGWDKITCEVVNYDLIYEKKEYFFESWDCGKEIFDKFILSHIEDFDISDNVHAQSPSYSWLDE